MKWFSRLAVVSAVLVFLLMVRSTMVSEHVMVLWRTANFDLWSNNGEFGFICSLHGDLRSLRWYPEILHPHERVGSWPSYEGAFGYAPPYGGSRWNGRGWEYGADSPHCLIVLALLLIPAGRYIVWRVRGRVTPPPPAGFEVAQSRTLA